MAAYRNVIPEGAWEQAKTIFGDARKPHWITLTSSSTVNNLVALVGKQALAGVRLASIGPITSATIREHGLEVDVEARQYTVDGLLEALSI